MTTYGGRWEIVESLPEGGQAYTFRVRDLTTHSEDFVLKRLRNPRRLGRLQQEIEALSRLNSARIPKVVDSSLESDPAYFVLPYLGESLQKVVEANNSSFEELVDYFRDIVEAVKDAHSAGIRHHDIKPNNVIIDNSAPHRRAYLIDFGICQFDDGGLFRTVEDERLGNPSFSSPELDPGSTIDVTDRSDIYSLGKLLFWTVSGGRFFRRELFPASMHHVPQPRDVERRYIQRLLEKTVIENPDLRISASDLMDLVQRYGSLMRQGVSVVGTLDQICPICRDGHLNRHKEKIPGLAGAGDTPGTTVILRCDYCGYIQLHDVRRTRSQNDGTWKEILG